MQTRKSLSRWKAAAGFALPSILVVVGALLILAVGVILLATIERSTARSFSDRQRAELAAAAAVEEVRGILGTHAANDDYVVLQASLPPSATPGAQAAPNLFLARGKTGSGGPTYQYTPLFSAATRPPDHELAAPALEEVVGTDAANYTEFRTLPYNDKVRVNWRPVLDEKNRMVARYAYWVEDLQSRVDAGTAGNTKEAGAHRRYGWKADDTSTEAMFPAAGLNALKSEVQANGRDKQPPLDQVALYALDPEATAKDTSNLDKTLIEGRKALISPDSVLAVAGVVPPLSRDDAGRLTDAKARALEENLTASVQPYDEQPVVPFAHGIDASVAGKPKLNLNAMLAKAPSSAVDEMAAWIKKGLPDFDSRKGGFPNGEDYLKTLAANAIGYAAPGNKPVVKMNSYRGLGASPTLSEIVLDINYLGYITQSGNKVMVYQFILFGEMFNHTNLQVRGNSALSYEVGLTLPGMGAGTSGVRFDDPDLLDQKTMSVHDLAKEGGRYWSKPVAVDLLPGEYRFYKFATVNYTINIGSGTVGASFQLTDVKEGAAGISTRWNGEEIDRVPSILRNSTSFNAGLRRYCGKAAIPGHSYGAYGFFINNMGDPRFAYYMRDYPLGENSFPTNISPNRRNVRYDTAYSSYGQTKVEAYGRVIPSEWPDGGHDMPVPPWSHGWNSNREGRPVPTNEGPPVSGTGPAFDPTTIANTTKPEPGEAVTFLSNRGRYYSATELGRIYDPLMYLPTFSPASGLDSTLLRYDGSPAPVGFGKMPAPGLSWPLVEVASTPHTRFGGGNTLRIGRPEHPKFAQPLRHAPVDMPGTHAARLLDLFHAGKSRSDITAEREGPVVRMEGHVNLNTASRESLRAIVAGYLTMDPKLSRRTSENFASTMAPPVQALPTFSTPTATAEGDKIADAIIRCRPYASPSELASVTHTDGKLIFGNRELFPEFYPDNNPARYPDQSRLQWSDAAAEEVFGRAYEASTVRSRNFRIWVIGQTVAPTAAGTTKPEVLSEVRRAYTVFADPGKRTNDGAIDPANAKVTLLHENDF